MNNQKMYEKELDKHMVGSRCGLGGNNRLERYGARGAERYRRQGKSGRQEQ